MNLNVAKINEGRASIKFFAGKIRLVSFKWEMLRCLFSLNSRVFLGFLLFKLRAQTSYSSNITKCKAAFVGPRIILGMS